MRQYFSEKEGNSLHHSEGIGAPCCEKQIALQGANDETLPNRGSLEWQVEMMEKQEMSAHEYILEMHSRQSPYAYSVATDMDEFVRCGPLDWSFYLRSRKGSIISEVVVTSGGRVCWSNCMICMGCPLATHALARWVTASSTSPFIIIKYAKITT